MLGGAETLSGYGKREEGKRSMRLCTPRSAGESGRQPKSLGEKTGKLEGKNEAGGDVLLLQKLKKLKCRGARRTEGKQRGDADPSKRQGEKG